MLIRPVHLVVRGEVVRCVRVPRAGFVEVREPEELLPIIRRQGALGFRNWRVGGRGLVAREDAAPEKVRGTRIERELKVAELIAVRDALVEPGNQPIRRLDLDRATDFVTRDETQRDGVDES